MRLARPRSHRPAALLVLALLAGLLLVPALPSSPVAAADDLEPAGDLALTDPLPILDGSLPPVPAVLAEDGASPHYVGQSVDAAITQLYSQADGVDVTGEAFLDTMLVEDGWDGADVLDGVEQAPEGPSPVIGLVDDDDEWDEVLWDTAGKRLVVRRNMAGGFTETWSGEAWDGDDLTDPGTPLVLGVVPMTLDRNAVMVVFPDRIEAWGWNVDGGFLERGNPTEHDTWLADWDPAWEFGELDVDPGSTSRIGAVVGLVDTSGQILVASANDVPFSGPSVVVTRAADTEWDGMQGGSAVTQANSPDATMDMVWDRTSGNEAPQLVTWGGLGRDTATCEWTQIGVPVYECTYLRDVGCSAPAVVVISEQDQACVSSEAVTGGDAALTVTVPDEDDRTVSLPGVNEVAELYPFFVDSCAQAAGSHQESFCADVAADATLVVAVRTDTDHLLWASFGNARTTGALTGSDTGGRVWVAPTSASGTPVLLPPVASDISVADPQQELVLTNPVPIAVLAAPPQVAGAGQGSTGTQFARSTSSGSGSSSSVSMELGSSIGLSVEDPTGTFGAGFSASVSTGVGSETSLSTEVSVTDAYNGLPEEDTLVYNVQRYTSVTGAISSSSLGIGLGDDVEILLPRGTVTSSAGVSVLRTRYPDLFGPDGELGPVLDDVLTHEVGDPGSYVESTEIDDYCDGSFSGDRELEPAAYYLGQNPFRDPPELPDRPDILTSAEHTVLVGAGNSEAAAFSIDESQSDSRVATSSLGFEATVKAGYVTGGFSTSVSASTAVTTTMGAGTAFNGVVGHIPGDNAWLEREAYDWTAFLCQRTVETADGTPYTVWVQDFAVDDYAGTGGLETLAPVEPVAHTEPADVASPLTLEWTQASGTVETYDWEIEEVGGAPADSGQVVAESPSEAASGERTESAEVTGLTAGKLYRWRVTATDFFGRATTSDWSYVATRAAVVARFVAAPPMARTGEALTFSNRSTGGVDATYAWDLDDGTTDATTAIGQTVVHAYDDPGTYDAELTATDAWSTDTVTSPVEVFAPGSLLYEAMGDELLVVTPSSGLTAGQPEAAEPEVVTEPAHGALLVDTDGGFTYRPDAGWCGATDTFRFVLVGATGTSDPIDVGLAVECPNTAPITGELTFDARYGETLDVPAPGLLSVAEDAEGPLVVDPTPRADPTGGDLVLGGDGSFTYTPTACGEDSFDYRVVDLGGLTATGTVDLVVDCSPALVEDRLTTAEDTPGTVDLLANDVDPVGRALAVTEVGTPEHGTLVPAPTDDEPGAARLVPDGNWCGTETVGYAAEVVDEPGTTYAGQVVLEVACVNDAPLAPAVRRVVTRQGKAGTGKAKRFRLPIGVYDVEGDPLAYKLPARTRHGRLRGPVGTASWAVYVPGKRWCGRERSRFVVGDGNGGTTVVRLVLRVRCR